jgi:hypothetical protein
MPIIPPDGRGPRPDPHRRRPLVTARRDHARDPCELAVSPGADPRDLAEAAAAPPAAVYTGHRPAAPHEAAVVLAFRTPPHAGPASPAPHGGHCPSGPTGWTPDPAAAAACAEPTALERALAELAAPAAYCACGQRLVRGLARCDPDTLIAVAGLLRSARTLRR